MLLAENEMSPLGKKLMKIANEVERSDDPAFDEQAVENELGKRRGD